MHLFTKVEKIPPKKEKRLLSNVPQRHLLKSEPILHWAAFGFHASAQIS